MSERPAIPGVADFHARLGAASRILLGLDYDGTLAPHRIDRMAAWPLPGVVEQLERLRDDNRVALALVSGRPLDELLELLGGGHGLTLIGSHGFERQDPGAPRRCEPLRQAESALLDTVMRQVAAEGFRHERKVASVGVHTRGLSPASARAVDARVRGIASGPLATSARLELRTFDGGLELRVVGIDKGTAFGRWLDAQDGANLGLPLYVGDDQTDEDAFAVVQARGGVGVKVGVAKTCAQGRVADCAAVLALLRHIG